MTLPTVSELIHTYGVSFNSLDVSGGVNTKDIIVAAEGAQRLAIIAVRNAVLDALIAEAENYAIPDSEGGWDIRHDVADWIRDMKQDGA